MTDLFDELSTIVSAGVGGLTFFGAWAYLMWQWLGSYDAGLGHGLFLGWLS